MATYNFTTSARNDVGLAAFRAEVNAQRAANGQSAITLAQAFDALASRACNEWADQADERDRQSLRDLYIAATPAQRAAARTALGG